ncbi:MAG: hypothetical protein RIT81_47165 [Deltaproteobacteria bacterium]
MQTEAPRTPEGELVGGYTEDMRAPYLSEESIGSSSEGDVRVPGERLFFFIGGVHDRTRDPEIKLYANCAIAEGGEELVGDWEYDVLLAEIVPRR